MACSSSAMSVGLHFPNNFSPFYQKPNNSSSSQLHFKTLFLSPQTLNSQFRRDSIVLSNKKQFKSQWVPVVVAAQQSNFLKVLQTVWRFGKDGIEAGTNLVPDFVPRPIARISVSGLSLAVSLFVLKSFVSTAFFVTGVMGLIYFLFIALNKDEGPKGGGGGGGGGRGGSGTTEDSLEEARRIMEKYK